MRGSYRCVYFLILYNTVHFYKSKLYLPWSCKWIIYKRITEHTCWSIGMELTRHIKFCMCDNSMPICDNIMCDNSMHIINSINIGVCGRVRVRLHVIHWQAWTTRCTYVRDTNMYLQLKALIEKCIVNKGAL